MLSMSKLFVELIKHATKYNENWKPLRIIDIMSIYKDTWYYCNDLSSCWDKWENMLFKVSYNIVDTYLANYLQYSDDKDIE